MSLQEDFDKFKQRQEITAFADNLKMVAVALLVVSVIVFSLIGEDTVRLYIWYWAATMTGLVIVCALLDVRNHFKMVRLGLK